MAVPKDHWFTPVSALLTSTLPQEYPQFAQTMEGLFSYVAAKHQGRCISRKIFLSDQRQIMIRELFEDYSSGKSPSTLCSTRFMRKISKCNKTEPENLKFICETIVPAYMSKLGKEKEFDDRVAAALRNLNVILIDPASLSHQRKLTNLLPIEFNQSLSIGRAKIGTMLVKATNSGWLTKQKIEDILIGIDDESFADEPPFEELAVIPYFIYQYQQLIASGASFCELFRESIFFGLNQYKNDPSVPEGNLTS